MSQSWFVCSFILSVYFMIGVTLISIVGAAIMTCSKYFKWRDLLLVGQVWSFFLIMCGLACMGGLVIDMWRI